jgi:protein-S-isoprenylcysteine O-methyltransferase Ste14
MVGRMFESFSAVDIRDAAILTGFLLVVFVPGLWYVKKTTGRPRRDMLAVLGAGIVLILFLIPAVVLFHHQLKSPDRHARRLAENIFMVVFAVVAIVISWAFNNLAKQRSSRKKHVRNDDMS